MKKKLKRRMKVGSMLLMACMSCAMLAAATVYGGLRKGEVAAMATSGERVELPILMYHSLMNDPGRQNDYVLSPEVFEQDLAYLQSRGYTAVTPTDLANWVFDGAPLPAKPIMITFDDAHLNTMTYGLPLLEKYDMKAVVSVVGEYTEKSVAEGDHNPAYSYLTWDEIRRLAESGRFEIGNHSFSLHTKDKGRLGVKKMRGESDKAYTDAVSLDLLKLQDMLERNCGLRPITFAYPFGGVDEASAKLVKQLGFRVSLSCRERINQLDQDDVECLYNLGRFNRPSFISTGDFMRKCGIE